MPPAVICGSTENVRLNPEMLQKRGNNPSPHSSQVFFGHGHTGDERGVYVHAGTRRQ